ncbi:MAG: CRISPR-associated helicase Cas3' [Chitinophagaceae bacterium]|nr:CRISPR-associated helicase Cas3' [Chitinophagaceae bacterium]
MPNKILAKTRPYEESLITHTENVLAVWQELKSRCEAILNKDADFWRRSFLSALFHDFGKVAQNFQLVIQGKKKYDENYIRHEFLSGVFLYYTDVKGYDENPLSLLAVFSHHKPLTDTLFQDDGFADIDSLEEDMILILEDFNNKVQMQGFNVLNPKLIPYCRKRFSKKNNGLSIIYDDYEKFFKNFKRNFPIQQEHRNEYILCKALLNISDWTASGHDMLTAHYSYTINHLQEQIIAKLRNEGKDKIAQEFRFRKFQIESKMPGNVLAIAPTGSGKTEASLIWASQKPEHSKILYLLPTRVTSNAIYERLKNYFGRLNTAVVHSSALLYRKEIDDNFEETEYLKDKTFFQSITVCTIDQVLTQGFNLGYWEIKTFHLFKARIIIDEIHLYQPFTLGLIISTIAYLKSQFSAEFFIMTATMPLRLKILLQKTLAITEQNLIQDNELLNEARNLFETRESFVDDLSQEIQEAIKKYRKVLIVVNTVDEAIRLYEIYKSKAEYTICFHSRFMQKDRFNKEQNILKREEADLPTLLIATQVIEVSLDIDFDIMFTENAPIDAIIQRAGRVNRKRNQAKESKVIVFKHQPITEEFIYTESDILTKTFDVLLRENKKRLTENDLIKMVDEVYRDFDIESHPSFLKGKKAYLEVQQSLHFVKDNTEHDKVFTREGLDSINVIPACFEEELHEKSAEYKTKYELSIRRTRKYSHKCYPDKKHNWFTYIDAEYNSKTGLKFKQKETQTHTMNF